MTKNAKKNAKILEGTEKVEFEMKTEVPDSVLDNLYDAISPSKKYMEEKEKELDLKMKELQVKKLEHESKGFFHVTVGNSLEPEQLEKIGEILGNMDPKRAFIVTDDSFKIEPVQDILEPKICKICGAKLIPPFDHCEYCDTYYGVPEDYLEKNVPELLKEYEEGEKHFAEKAIALNKLIETGAVTYGEARKLLDQQDKDGN